MVEAQIGEMLLMIGQYITLAMMIIKKKETVEGGLGEPLMY